METRHIPRGLEHLARDVAEVHCSDDRVKAAMATSLEAIEECPSIGTAVASHPAGGMPGGVSSWSAQWPVSRARTAGSSDWVRGLSARPAGAAGSVTVTVVLPWGGQSMASVPRCASMSRRQVGRPRPEPRVLVVKNGVKTFSRTSGGMPGPVGELDAAGGAIAIDGDGDGPTPLHGLGAVDQQVVEDDLAMAATPVGGRKKTPPRPPRRHGDNPGPEPAEPGGEHDRRNCRNGTRRVRFHCRDSRPVRIPH